MRRGDCVPCLEFKSADGAWYEVSLKLENDKLKVHFEGDFAGARDEEISLENVKDLQELEAEFRLPSRQLIDEECEKVTPGMVVCASHTGMDRRTFDARVEKVTGSKVKHIFVDGEEQCNCIYEVLWLAGPYERERTSIYCENIYLLQSKKIQRHPVIKDVVKYLENRKDSLMCIPFLMGDAKDGSVLKNCSNFFVDGFSEGWIDDDSPKLGKNCGTDGNVEGNSDNDSLYFFRSGDANLVYRNKEFPEDWSARLGNCHKSASNVIIEDESGDMQNTDMVIVSPPNMKVLKNWDVAKNEGVMNDQICGKNTGCEQPLDGLKTPCLTPKKRKDRLLSDVYACEDVTCNRENKSGAGTRFCISDSMRKPQGKQPRDDESDSVKNPIKGNISCEKGNDALVKVDNVTAEYKLLELTPKSCCGHTEDLPPKHTSKYTATGDLPPVQCEYAHHSPIGLHDFSTDNLHDGYKCHCRFCRNCCPCCTHFHSSHEYCAECGRYICSVVGRAPHYCSEVVCTGCCSVCKELAASSSDHIEDGDDCLEPLKDEFTDYKSQSELSRAGNLELSTHQPSTSCKKLHCGGMEIVNNKGKCNILEQTVGQISMNVTCQPRREEELQDQHKFFASSHVILLENLDKDVNPSDVLGIIRQAGVDFVKVYVSPPQNFQKFTRGIVCFEDQESFQRVSAFLQNEDIIVTSSKGRPWVVIDAENGLSEGSFGGYTTGPKCCEISSNKVQICWRGTPEYESAKRSRDKFLEWWEDLKLLHQTLANKETAL